ncbi:MAG TPA: isochorismate synthase [Acidimicrobiales bacterium]|nr:isochorismate synthase [Acidimicrobiales bacterium]
MTSTAPGPGLVARTVWLDGDHGDGTRGGAGQPGPAIPDLIAFAGDDGLLFSHDGSTSFGARGVALRVPARRATEALAAVEVEDAVGRPGCGAIVVGALPFMGASGGELVIPRTVVGREPDGRGWMTTVTGGSGPPGDSDRAAVPSARSAVRDPDEFTLRPFPPHDQWCDAVAAAVAAIRNSRQTLVKVVLARQVVVEANRPISPAHVAARLMSLYPSCMIFSIDGFLGASPELLVSRRGDAVSSQPLAGTIPRSGEPEVDRRLAAGLLASTKERQEHALVVDEVADRLRSHCTAISVPEVPVIVPLRNVSHLGTRITGTLAAGAPSALDLALLLHPTPAVAGTPTAEALGFLDRVEPGDRGRYTGPVGWMDARGDGDWAVAIRCAELDGHRARLYAGAGVVADSTPEAELAETQLKLQALLAAVVRP